MKTIEVLVRTLNQCIGFIEQIGVSGDSNED
jgi:hypothetical protein